ncbi:hypothetical protein EXN66_Car018006 [Channa argus]|uniref:Uncharacterized protein n=1 Tax=Channa argus TaxID=215402 RepID=A0A6G1QJ88_CHAAH|nr:hypothetical protein EXN66_Car018006 [Channa argus]
MELLTTAVLIVLLTTTSAKPISRHPHQDADIRDRDSRRVRLNGKKMWSLEFSNFKGSSSESEDSDSSDSSGNDSSSSSSEEVTRKPRPTPTTNTKTTAFMTTAPMTVVTEGEKITPTPEPDTGSTDGPIVTTPLPGTPRTLIATLPTNLTHCVTIEFQTTAPITEGRGDS